MFNEFVKRINTLVEETLEKLNGIEQEKREARNDFNKKRLTAEVLQEKLAELNQQIPTIRAEYTGAANVIKAEFSDAVTKFFALDGSKVHEDAKIFDYDVTLTEEQLQNLVEKHKENSFMLQLIRKYAENHNILIVMPMGEKEYRDKFEEFLRHASYTVFNPDALTSGFFLGGHYDPGFDKADSVGVQTKRYNAWGK